jgi:sulfate transport system permease protein
LAADVATVEAPPRAAVARVGGGLARGIAVGYLSLVVLVPLAALIWSARADGMGAFWHEVTAPQAAAALKLTLACALIVAAFNAVAGTAVAWVLVRDEFPGKSVVDSVIDLPFALPTIVASVVLLELYGPSSPFGVDLAFKRAGVVLALLFVTLPFVVRTVQPVLEEMESDVEEAAASLGASTLQTFRRVVFPNILPGILSGVALAFAKAVGEFGSLVIITGNLPFKTEVSSVYIFGRIQSGDTHGAAVLSVILLAISFAVLLGIGAFRRWATRHDVP